MFDKEDSNNEIIRKVAEFEEMLSGNSFTFFDVEDFENIIDYYLDVQFNLKVDKALELALDQYPNELSLVLIKVEVLNSKQFFDKSYELLRSIVGYYPNNVEVVLNLGKLASVKNEFSSAVEYIDHALCLAEMDSSPLDIYSEISHEYLQLGETRKAIDVMKKILFLDSKNESILMELGVAYHESGDYDEAHSYFSDLIDEKPYCHLAWFNLGTLYNVKEQWNDALFNFDMCLVIKEDFTAAYYGKANSCIQLKEYQKAIDVFNDSFTFDHPHSYAYCSIGECYEKLGDFSKALLFYEKSLEIDDSQSDAWLGIGVVRDLNNEPKEAKKFIEKAIRLEPDNSEYWYILAELLMKLNSMEEAVFAFKKVVELDPANIDAWIDYSNFLFDNNSKSKAIKEVERAIKNNSDQLDLQLRLVAMQISAGKLIDAKKGLMHLQNAQKSSCEKLFDIYPEAKNIPEIINVIKLYKNDESS